MAVPSNGLGPGLCRFLCASGGWTGGCQGNPLCSAKLVIYQLTQSPRGTGVLVRLACQVGRTRRWGRSRAPAIFVRGGGVVPARAQVGYFPVFSGKRVRLVGKPRTRPIRASTFTCRERAVLQPQATAAARRLDHTTTWPPTQHRARQLLLAPWPSEQRCHGNVIATCTGLVLTTRTSFLPTFSARPGPRSCPGLP